VLRGAELEELKAAKRVTWLAINIAYNLRLEVAYLNDRCASLLPLVNDHSKDHADNHEPMLSSSLRVRFGKTDQWCTTEGEHCAFRNQHLMATSVWMTQGTQCKPAELKYIKYYTELDLSLGHFLAQNCFNPDQKCQNVNCKRGVRDHVLSYVHHDGQVRWSTVDGLG
ncbi:unnamed protein product, partial [Discosporangium mesarthrocarpum]